MTIEDLLAWLHLADLEGLSEQSLRSRLLQVTEQVREPGSSLHQELLEEIAEQLESQSLERETMAEWPEVYAALLPESLTNLETLEEAMQARVDSLAEAPSSYLQRFEQALEFAVGEGQAIEVLDSLQSELGQAWDDYRAQPVEAQAASSESVVAHRLLEDGFGCWFEALELARRGEREEALAAALEGNRLLHVLAKWGDEIA